MPAASHTVCLMLYDYVPLTGVSLAKGAILDSEMHASTTERIDSSVSGVWRWELAQSVNSIRVFVSFLVSFIVASQLAERSTRIPTLPIALSGNTWVVARHTRKSFVPGSTDATASAEFGQRRMTSHLLFLYQ